MNKVKSMELSVIINCPYCEDGEAPLMMDDLGFYYKCGSCSEEFTTTETDEINLKIKTKEEEE